MKELTGIAYGLPFEEYRKAEEINCSGLKRILQSPMHYKAELEEEDEETKALRIGRAVHSLVLEPATFHDLYLVAPEINKRTKAGKAEWAELMALGKTLLTQEEHSDILKMASALSMHPTTKRLFSIGNPEVTVFTEIEGIPAKIRMDWPRNGLIIDLKTTDDASPEGFARSIAKFGYDMQAAWYLDCAQAAGIDANTFLFVAVEKSAPYAIGIYELDQESIEIGRAKCRKALNLYRYCKETGDYFGYSPDIITLSLPRWAKLKEND